MKTLFWSALIIFTTLGDVEDEEAPSMAPSPNPKPILAETLVDEHTPKKYRVADFYHYTDVGKVKGLPLADRLVLMLEPKWRKDDRRAEYLKKFHQQIAPVLDVVVKNGRIVVELDMADHAKDRLQYIVDKLTQIPVFEEKILKEKATTALPVVIIGGQECYPTSEIFIKTKSPVTLDLLRQRLQSSTQPIGEFTILSLNNGEDGRTYYLTVSNLKWPSNVLVLANLLSEQSWVEFAQVLFQPLDQPIEAQIDVLPNASPTLGEQRQMVLTVTIFDPTYQVNVDLLPQLGRGEFLPLDTTNQQAIESVFFYAGEAKVFEQEIRKGKVKQLTVTWPFYVYRPGVYRFATVAIPYLVKSTGKETAETLSVVSQRLAVNSVIKKDLYPLNDIQPMKFYSLDKSADTKTVVAAEKENAWKVDKGLAGKAALVLGGLIVLLVLIVVCYRIVKLAYAKLAVWQQRQSVISDLRRAARLVRKDGLTNYPLAERCLRRVMAEFFDLPFNITFRELKVQPKSNVSDILIDCLEEFERTCDPNYKPTNDVINFLDFKLRQTVYFAKHGSGSDDD